MGVFGVLANSRFERVVGVCPYVARAVCTFGPLDDQPGEFRVGDRIVGTIAEIATEKAQGLVRLPVSQLRSGQRRQAARVSIHLITVQDRDGHDSDDGGDQECE